MARKLNREGMRKAMEAALPAPKVPPFAGLVLGLTSAGAKIVPPDLWDELAEALKEEEVLSERGDMDGEKVGQFEVHTNHDRTENHEVWQPDFVSRLQDKAGRKTVWIVPVDELVCMAYGDEYACEFIEIMRLSFVGTERQMRAAVKELLETFKVKAVQEG